jgi:hypothetical protein
MVVALGISAWWEATRRSAARGEPDPRLGDGAVAARVEVLNGSGFEGEGGRVATRLREAGFQVVEVRNADRFDYPVTLVVDRTADGKAAREVSRALAGARILRQRAPVDWEVTVIVGRDRRDRS